MEGNHQDNARDAIYIGSLIYRQLNKDPLSDEEKQELEEWLKNGSRRKDLLEQVTNRRVVVKELKFLRDEYDTDEAIEKVFEALGLEQAADGVIPRRSSRRVALQVAAAVLLLVGGVWLFQLTKRETGIREVVSGRHSGDIPAGKNRAILLLTDGRRIELDSLQNGRLEAQGNATVINHKGSLSYQANSSPRSEEGVEAVQRGKAGKGVEAVSYNTIVVPRGGQYQLTLADGTAVWLNAASSLRFPTVFTGNSREVELSGEGYFEAAKDEKRPFIVHCRNADVKVLGTAFNIMAYEDEPGGTQTTLVSGRVAVSAHRRTLLLQPGKAATVRDSALYESDVQIGQVTAWKNGEIALYHTDLGTLMRQVSRWYDINITFRGPIPKRRFGGKINRNVNLSILLEFFRVNGIQSSLNNRDIQLYE